MNKLDLRKLYFAVTDKPELNIGDVQTTVGITIKFNNKFLGWVYQTGDFGGEPETLDCTPLSATVQMNKAGIQSVGNWTINYRFTDEGFQSLETDRKAGTMAAIVVTMPNGSTFTNNGKCTANYMTGITTNAVGDGTAVFELSNPDGWEFTPATSSVG